MTRWSATKLNALLRKMECDLRGQWSAGPDTLKTSFWIAELRACRNQHTANHGKPGARRIYGETGRGA